MAHVVVREAGVPGERTRRLASRHDARTLTCGAITILVTLGGSPGDELNGELSTWNTTPRPPENPPPAPAPPELRARAQGDSLIFGE